MSFMTPPDRTLYPISFGVIATHICAIVASFFLTPSHALTPPPPPKLLVKTISLKPAQQISQPREELVIAEAEPAPLPPTPPPEPEPQKPEPTPETPKSEPAPEPPPPAPEPKVEPKTEPEKKPEIVPEPTPPSPKPAVKPKPKKPQKKPDPVTPKPPAPKPKTDAKPKPKPAAAVKKAPAPKKADTPAPTKKTADKKTTDPKPAPVVEQKPPSPPKPSAEEIAAQKKQQALIAQAKEKIANIGKSRDKGSVVAATGLPEGPAIAHLESLQIEALPVDSGEKFTPQESSYRDELARHLKLLLKLPEYGTVKIKLTLDRAGKVKKVEVVKAENSANRNQVENTLPTIKFPPFGSNFEGLESFTFTIILRNE